jgi:hypothetical protein
VGYSKQALITNSEARQYFADKGLTYNDITEGDIATLSYMLNQRIKRAAKYGEITRGTHLSANMDIDMRDDGSIKGCYLYVSAPHYADRECVSFNENGFIGFAGWSDDEIVQPILQAFIEWCDIISDWVSARKNGSEEQGCDYCNTCDSCNEAVCTFDDAYTPETCNKYAPQYKFCPHCGRKLVEE